MRLRFQIYVKRKSMYPIHLGVLLETCHSLSQPRPHDPKDTHGHTGTSLCPAPTHTDAACLPLCCMPQICSAAAAPRTMVCCGNQTWPKMICESLATAPLVKLRSKKPNMCKIRCMCLRNCSFRLGTHRLLAAFFAWEAPGLRSSPRPSHAPSLSGLSHWDQAPQRCAGRI